MNLSKGPPNGPPPAGLFPGPAASGSVDVDLLVFSCRCWALLLSSPAVSIPASLLLWEQVTVSLSAGWLSIASLRRAHTPAGSDGIIDGATRRGRTAKSNVSSEESDWLSAAAPRWRDAAVKPELRSQNAPLLRLHSSPREEENSGAPFSLSWDLFYRAGFNLCYNLYFAFSVISVTSYQRHSKLTPYFKGSVRFVLASFSTRRSGRASLFTHLSHPQQQTLAG